MSMPSRDRSPSSSASSAALPRTPLRPVCFRLLRPNAAAAASADVAAAALDRAACSQQSLQTFRGKHLGSACLQHSLQKFRDTYWGPHAWSIACMNSDTGTGGLLFDHYVSAFLRLSACNVHRMKRNTGVRHQPQHFQRRGLPCCRLQTLNDATSSFKEITCTSYTGCCCSFGGRHRPERLNNERSALLQPNAEPHTSAAQGIRLGAPDFTV
eukprot:1157325-Pelagomonas_calceolata.AAC.19